MCWATSNRSVTSMPWTATSRRWSRAGTPTGSCTRRGPVPPRPRLWPARRTLSPDQVATPPGSVRGSEPGVGSPRPEVACRDERDRLAARGRPGHPVAGAPRPRGRAGRRRRRRAGPGRARGLGHAAARARGSRRALGRRRVLPRRLHRRGAGPAVDRDDAHAADPAAPRSRPGERLGPSRHRARGGQLPLGARRAALLRRRGRAVHQRPDDRDRCLLRRRRLGSRRAGPRRAARGRRLELRGGERLGPLVVRHHDQRPRRAAGVRAGHRRLGRGSGGATLGGGVPARAGPVPPQEHRRRRRRGVSPARVSLLLALRRAARARLLPRQRRRTGSAHG